MKKNAKLIKFSVSKLKNLKMVFLILVAEKVKFRNQVLLINKEAF